MFAPEMRVEVGIRNPSLVSTTSLRMALIPALRPRLVLPILFATLWPLHIVFILPLLVLPLFVLPPLLLHLAIVFLSLRMPVPTLRLLLRTPFVLRRRLATIPALRLLIPAILRPGLILPVLLLSIVLAIVAMVILRDRHRRSCNQ